MGSGDCRIPAAATAQRHAGGCLRIPLRRKAPRSPIETGENTRRHPTDMNGDRRFVPPFYLRHPFVQTALCSSRLRTLGRNPMQAFTRPSIIDAGDSIRLQGFWSTQPGRSPRGLVILLHGWEGSVDSAYMLTSGRFLFSKGYDIFRLNLRDHGATHHLNEGLFLGTLLDEVFGALSQVASQSDGLPVFLAGFSIGGSFALRVARRCADNPIPSLRRVVCVNPPIDPMKSTQRIDELQLIKRYFINKWKRSLIIKQDLFPNRYDFGDILRMNSCMAMTEALVRRYTEYDDAADYFSRYTLTRGWLERVPLPVTVVTAADDPVVPVEDFYRTKTHRNVRLIVHRYGGHCGFLTGPRLSSWVENRMAAEFGEAPQEKGGPSRSNAGR